MDGDIMNYKCTLSSAREFAAANKLEDWIHAFLLSDGDNKAFSDGLKICERFYIGPILMPLFLFTRCVGPEEDMKYRTTAESFKKHVNGLQKILEQTQDMPPLIVNYVDGRFELNDGNHRFEALKRLGVTEFHFVVWITDLQDYNDFNDKFIFN